MAHAKRYSIAREPFGTLRGDVYTWARWTVRASIAEHTRRGFNRTHYLCRSFDCIRKLRRYVRRLRVLAFVSVPLAGV